MQQSGIHGWALTLVARQAPGGSRPAPGLGDGDGSGAAGGRSRSCPGHHAPQHLPRDEAAAKLHYEKGTAAYALGDFVEAARQYEEAFRLKLNPALLFNAAQAQRRAGNRQRAIELYENLLRVFPTGSGHEKARQHLDELRRSVGMALPATSAPPGPTPLAPALREGGPPPGPARPRSTIRRGFWRRSPRWWSRVWSAWRYCAAGDKPARPSWGQVGR